jgi:hypothetical protein
MRENTRLPVFPNAQAHSLSLHLPLPLIGGQVDGWISLLECSLYIKARQDRGCVTIVSPSLLPLCGRKIRLIEGKVKCRHLKIYLSGDFRQAFICLRPQYTYSHREGGGGELNQRDGERGNSSPS